MPKRRSLDRASAVTLARVPRERATARLAPASDELPRNAALANAEAASVLISHWRFSGTAANTRKELPNQDFGWRASAL